MMYESIWTGHDEDAAESAELRSLRAIIRLRSASRQMRKRQKQSPLRRSMDRPCEADSWPGRMKCPTRIM